MLVMLKFFVYLIKLYNILYFMNGFLLKKVNV